MIQIDIALTKADIMIARLLVYFRSGWGVAVIAIASGLSWSNYYMQGKATTGGSFPFDTVWGPLVFGCLVIPVAVMFAGINGAAVGKMLAPVQYRFDDRGFELVAPHLSARFAWPEVRRAYESGGLLVLSTPGALQVIPKRFAETETLDALKLLLKTSMSSRAKVK